MVSIELIQNHAIEHLQKDNTERQSHANTLINEAISFQNDFQYFTWIEVAKNSVYSNIVSSCCSRKAI